MIANARTSFHVAHPQDAAPHLPSGRADSVPAADGGRCGRTVCTRPLGSTSLLYNDAYARHERELSDDAGVEELRQRPAYRPEPAHAV
jgi:hypothetical protein